MNWLMKRNGVLLLWNLVAVAVAAAAAAAAAALDGLACLYLQPSAAFAPLVSMMTKK